jgi:hypothetical protein
MPSTQSALEHWAARLHGEPCASAGTQTPAEQKLPAVHSPSSSQSPAHAVGPQSNAPQLWV